MADQTFASLELAEQLGQRLCARRWQVSTAESCTGGLIGGAITAVAGSSAWFEQGFITYSNAAKVSTLAVPAELIEMHGAVSLAVVAAMAIGACRVSGAEVGIAVSGVAGPGGGTEDKPLGTVCVGWVLSDRPVETRQFQFPGGRLDVRQATVQEALRGTIRLLDEQEQGRA